MQGPSRLVLLLNPAVEAAGYRLVRLRVSGGQRKTIQIMAERPDGHMGVEDCAKLSRALDDVLEAADPVDGEYVLEVSSPGTERPLTKPQHFRRYLGRRARVRTRDAVDGHRSFTGELVGASDDVVTIAADSGVVAIPYAEIQRSHLIEE